MKTVFIIHGTGGSPEGNWFPWMKQKLEQVGYQVFVPKFPTPENQTLDSWKQVFEAYQEYVDEDTIFIAHSVGPSFVCAILEEIRIFVKACYFASGFLGKIDIESFDVLNETFTCRDFNWSIIREKSQSFYMCHGSNDPYVPMKNAEDLAKKLGVEIDTIENGGHLNEESGYTEFQYLLDKIVL